MEIFTTDKRVVSRAGWTPGIDPAAVPILVRARLLVDGQPIFRDDRMRPVEPASSWSSPIGTQAYECHTFLCV